MNTFKELKSAIKKNLPLKWNDPEPIKGNDYTISFIQNLHDFDASMTDVPITIQYNKGLSEAEVFLHEIIKIN